MKTFITNINQLPKICGIYKVIDSQGTVIYVGQSKNIYKRWNDGHQVLPKILKNYQEISGIYIECIEIPEFLLNRAENLAIKFHQPWLNQKLPPTF
jgi:excinuclease UvrABC nuclease subunit